MYCIIRPSKESNFGGDFDIFGPFPSERRAEQYAESFDDEEYQIHPIIVPNCVQVKLVY